MTRTEKLLGANGLAVAFAALVLCYAFFDPNAANVSTGSAALNSVIPVGKQGAFVDLNPFPLWGKAGVAFCFSTALYYVCTAMLGVLMLSPFAGVAGLSGMTWALAGLAPGYLAVTMLNRLCTLVLPNGAAPFAIWLLLLGGAAYAYLKLASVREKLEEAGWVKRWLWVVGALALAFVFLIHNIESGGGFLAGDGLRAYVNFLTEQATRDFNPGAHFPMADLHYDELLFNYGLVFLRPFFESLREAPVVLYFWIWRGVGKLSCLFLAYALFRWQKLPKSLSIAATIFLFFGTNSLSPLYYLVSFDTLNPLVFNVTAARVLTVLLPFLLVALIDLAAKRGWDRRLAFSAATFGLGISAISFHTSWYVIAFLVVYAVGASLEKDSKSVAGKTNRYWGAAALTVVFLVLYPILADIGNDHRKTVVPVLLLLSVVSLATLGLAWARQDSRASRRKVWTWGAALLFVLLLLFGLKLRWIHFRHVLIFTALSALIHPLSARVSVEYRRLEKLKHVFAALTLVILCATYLRTMDVARHHKWVAMLPLLAMACGGVYWLFDLDLSRERARAFLKSVPAKLAGICLAFLIFGCLFLGNSPAKALLPKLGFAVNWLPLRDVVDLTAPKYFFTPMNCDSGPSRHCMGLWHFVGYYGIFILASVLSYVLLERNKEPGKTALKRRLQRFAVLSVVLMAFGFLMSDFMWLAIRPWYMTRLIEAATYFVMIVFFLTVGQFGGRRLVTAVSAIAVAWAVFPFLLSQRVDQWLANLRFFLHG